MIDMIKATETKYFIVVFFVTSCLLKIKIVDLWGNLWGLLSEYYASVYEYKLHFGGDVTKHFLDEKCFG